MLSAELGRDRLRAALPRLRQLLGEAQAREYAERWDARYRRVRTMVEEAAETLRRYPALVAELIGLLKLAAEVDNEVSAVNSAAPDDERRRLAGVELTARGLEAFSTAQPSLAKTVQLPDFDNSSVLLWPDRSSSAQAAIAFAESMAAASDRGNVGPHWDDPDYSARLDAQRQTEREAIARYLAQTTAQQEARINDEARERFLLRQRA